MFDGEIREISTVGSRLCIAATVDQASGAQGRLLRLKHGRLLAMSTYRDCLLERRELRVGLEWDEVARRFDQPVLCLSVGWDPGQTQNTNEHVNGSTAT